VLSQEHNKKVRTRYFGDETSEIPLPYCPEILEGLAYLALLASGPGGLPACPPALALTPTKAQGP